MGVGPDISRLKEKFRRARTFVTHALLTFLDLIGLYSYRRGDQEAQLSRFRSHHIEFRGLLTANNNFLTVVNELEESRMGDALPHPAWVKKQVLRAAVDVHRMVKCLNAISDNRYPKLAERYQIVSDELARRLEGVSGTAPSSWVMDLSETTGRACVAGGRQNGQPRRNPQRPGAAHTAGIHGHGRSLSEHDSRSRIPAGRGWQRARSQGTASPGTQA